MRGILMIEPLYHQVIAGLKTQTRRKGGLEQINGCKATKTKPAIIANPDDWEFVRRNEYHAKFWKKNDALHEVYCKPRYRVGEVLYLKEPFQRFPRFLHPNGYGYKFGVPENYVANQFGKQTGFNDNVGWKNKLFMPQAAARAFIKITGIRCERLLDISTYDAIAEGIEKDKLGFWKDYGFNKGFTKPKDSFITLYTLANKMSRHDPIVSLWVWVYQFEYLKDYKNA